MSWRIAGMLALCLGSLSHAQDWSEIERAFLDEQKAWTLASESSTGLTSYFEDELTRLESERADLSTERSDLKFEKASLATEREQSRQEKSVLETLRQQSVSDRLQINADSTRLNEREKAVDRVEWMVRAAPWVAVGVFTVGVVVGVLLSQ